MIAKVLERSAMPRFFYAVRSQTNSPSLPLVVETTWQQLEVGRYVGGPACTLARIDALKA